MENERLKCSFCFVGLIIINLMVAIDSTTLSVALPVCNICSSPPHRLTSDRRQSHMSWTPVSRQYTGPELHSSYVPLYFNPSLLPLPQLAVKSLSSLFSPSLPWAQLCVLL